MDGLRRDEPTSHRIIHAPIKVDRLVLKTMPLRRQAQESPFHRENHAADATRNALRTTRSTLFPTKAAIQR
jgi:hypothetical protein